jgi:outer membrane murein-binding lipoprotein Lpp
LWLSPCLPAACSPNKQQVQVLESEVADLEKKLALRSEMEAAQRQPL